MIHNDLSNGTTLNLLMRTARRVFSSDNLILMIDSSLKLVTKEWTIKDLPSNLILGYITIKVFLL